MQQPDLSALIRWPNVPACYGWLSLDRRGRWRLQGEPVTHQGFIEFINRQYGCDEAGNWFLQNGPQRVFAALEYTPWVLKLAGNGQLLTHTGSVLEAVREILVDEDGALLFSFDEGIGVLDDRDLAAAYALVTDPSGQTASDDSLEAALASGNWQGLCWQGLPLTAIARNTVAKRYGFNPAPKAD